MQLRTLKQLLLIITLFPLLVATIGCGGGGSSSDNTDVKTLRPTLCPGTLSFEDGGSENILLAAVKGNGVEGWVENIANKQIGDKLTYQPVGRISETMIRHTQTSLGENTYILKYFANSESFELKKEQISWVGTPGFFSAPTPPTWDGNFRRLTVNLPSVSGGMASYYVRLYDAAVPRMFTAESFVQHGGLVNMYVYRPGTYLVMLIADIIENGQVVGTARHLFSEMLLE